MRTPTGIGQVAIAGDWHGNAAWALRVIQAAAAAGITRILHVGDFRIGPWPGDGGRYLAQVSGECLRLGIDLWITPGNHENWKTIDDLVADQVTPGPALLAPGVFVLAQGSHWEWDGVRFGSLGGAFSVDKDFLIEGEDWWPREVPTDADVEALGHGKLDVLITHDVPSGVRLKTAFKLPYRLERPSQAVRDLLGRTVAATGPSRVFSGHWHQRTTGVLQTPAGQCQVHVLDREWEAGNAVMLDLADLSVRPLEVSTAPPGRGPYGH